jgi:hypothetical protein
MRASDHGGDHGHAGPDEAGGGSKKRARARRAITLRKSVTLIFEPTTADSKSLMGLGKVVITGLILSQ